MQAVIPEPQLKTLSLSIEISFFLKMLVNSSLFLKVLSLLINNWKGKFLEPSIWAAVKLFFLLSSKTPTKLITQNEPSKALPNFILSHIKENY